MGKVWRVTQIRRYPVAGGAEDTCQRADFTYDSGTNGWGRLVSVTWDGASCTGGAWSQSFPCSASLGIRDHSWTERELPLS